MAPSNSAVPLDAAAVGRLSPSQVEQLARELFEADQWTPRRVKTPGWVALERGASLVIVQARGAGRWHLTPAVVEAANGAATRIEAEAAWLTTGGTFAPSAWEIAKRTRVRLADRNLLLQWLHDRLPARSAQSGPERTITCNGCGAPDQVRFAVDGHGPLYCGRCYRRQRRATRTAQSPLDAGALEWAA